MKDYEYEVQGLYCGAWECVTTEPTRSMALARLREYRDNEPNAFRIKRVEVEA